MSEHWPFRGCMTLSIPGRTGASGPRWHGWLSRSDQAGSERDDVILEEAASAASIAVDGRSRSDAARIPERRA
ncbi:MAG TPA: hypothetical protein VKY90_06225, partial [Candidatus Dormibacteraeota bacterium]|nr:hypothetical protein [Candidatus Dormibacteraeota bacterium]